MAKQLQHCFLVVAAACIQLTLSASKSDQVAQHQLIAKDAAFLAASSNYTKSIALQHAAPPHAPSMVTAYPGGWLVEVLMVAYSRGIHTPRRGLVDPWLVFGFVLLAAALVGVAACAMPGRSSAEPDASKEPEIDMEEFKHSADNGALDFYTCMALSAGRYKGDGLKRFVPKLFVLMMMQLVLGCLLIRLKLRGVEEATFYPEAQDVSLRMVGLILYCYSAHSLVNSMADECREMLINYLISRNTSGWYEWPLILGEAMNTFIGLLLMIILYLIFCHTARPEELLMNCIAVNFVADVDNELVTEDEAKEAFENLEVAVEEWQGEDGRFSARAATWVDHVQHGVLMANHFIRICIPGVAVILIFSLAFTHNRALCNMADEVSRFPFCLGLNDYKVQHTLSN